MQTHAMQPPCHANPRHAKPQPQPEIAPHVAGSEPSLLERPLLGNARTSDITEKYELGQVLGRGAYGTTRIATDRWGGGGEAGKGVWARLQGGGRRRAARRGEGRGPV